MLGPGHYLLGVAEIGILVGFVWLGASRVRSRLVPEFGGAPAHLATAVLALALLIWVAEILGTVSLFEPVPYLVAVVGIGLALRVTIQEAPTTSPAESVVGVSWIVTAGALVIAVVALVHFAGGVQARLGTGMTGFDSTWYHGPFAAGFFQSGNTWDLHFIAPQFLAWFYPANGEIFHGIGMLAFGRDVLSPLLNLGWFLGCLVACWCIGRPYRVAPWSLGLGAIALSVPAFADQAGEARNDIVGVFFLLAAVALALNGRLGRGEGEEEQGLSVGALAVVGLAGGLAAGTKLNFLLPAALLVVGLAAISPRGLRVRAFCISALAALAGGGYWYLRNLVHTGNPLPWVDDLGPISLPAPDQALGGREAHSVLSYLGDGTVWSDWFLPGLHDGLWILWPLLGAAALAGLVLAAASLFSGLRSRSKSDSGAPGSDAALAMAGAVGLAAALAWLVAPTSASGPESMPRGFESGLRYLAPALVLGFALLPATRPLRSLLPKARLSFETHSDSKDNRVVAGARYLPIAISLALILAVAIGYPVQRHYLDQRYENPTFTTPGLNAAFAWSRDISDARIATTSTRQYPLFGTDLSNHVQLIGEERSHGGFEAPTTCPQYRRLLNAGDYDYVITTRDRLEPGKPPFPEQARWTTGPGAQVVLKKPPTVVFKLTERLDPSGCS